MARRSYGDGIELVRGQIDDPKQQGLLLLFINRRLVQATQTQVALFARLYRSRGRVVPYRELSKIMGHVGENRPSLWQYIRWIKRLLAEHKLPYVITMALEIGYALCEIQQDRRAKKGR